MRVGMLAALFAVLAAACGGGGAVLAVTPLPDDAPATAGIPAPEGPFAVPVPEAEWLPAMHGGDEGRMLSAAIADRKSVMLVLGRSADAAFEEQVVRMCKAAAPDTAVVARSRGTLDLLLEERGEIPYRVTMEPAGTDILGRPYFLPREHPLYTDWLARKKALKGAEGLLTVRPITVDDQRLRELRERRRGGCEDAQRELAAGSDQAATFFGPYLEAANRALEAAFRRHLEQALPFWRAEVDDARGRAAPTGPEARCLAAYAGLAEALAPCLSRPCPLVPRLHLAAGGLVAFDPGALDAIPEGCPAEGGRDYRRELDQVHARAVDEVLESLNGSWTGEILRFGAFERIAAAFGDACATRHRRIAAGDVDATRTAVRETLERLAGQDLAGEWYAAAGLERSPGHGPVRVLARLRPTGIDPRAEASGLTERLRRLDRCEGRGERTLQAALVDVGTSEVVFMGIFFEEQLLCEDLAPGQP
ncbi:MAG TPA: hypothetical protein VM285_08490 [Polyangia bacterium]|nr:hypothetical protein [Polyangia bacterium]